MNLYHIQTKRILDFKALTWIPQLDLISSERMPEKYGCQEIGGGIRFELKGPPKCPKSMKWACDMTPVDLSAYVYFSIVYKAEMLLREKPEQPVVSFSGYEGQNNPVAEPIFKLLNISSDGCWHTATLKMDVAIVCARLVVSLDSRDSFGYIEINRIEFAAGYNDLAYCIQHDKHAVQVYEAFHLIDLTNRYDAGYQDLISQILARPVFSSLKKRRGNSMVIDGGRYFDAGMIQIKGIPFNVAADGSNLISPPPESDRNNEIITSYGLQVKRGLVAPISRDDLTAIEVDRQAAEIYFLLVSDIPATKIYKYVVVASFTEAQLFDEISEPSRIEDIEGFAVELMYVDGTTEFAFPYSLKEDRYIIQGMTGAYAVPANKEKVLQKVIFHNRIRGGNIYVAAVTVNQGETGIYTKYDDGKGNDLDCQRWKCCQGAGIQTDPNSPAAIPYLRIDGNLIRIGNSHVSMEADVTAGLSIRSLVNHQRPDCPIRLLPDSCLEIKAPDGDCAKNELSLVNINVDSGSPVEKSVKLTYSCQIKGHPVDLMLELAINDKPEIRFKLACTNKSAERLDTTILFPSLKGLTIGSVEETWYFYPKYRNILDKRNVVLDNQASTTFPMQFYDIFNPAADSGISVMTEETGYTVRKYGLSKDETGVSCFVGYPELYTQIMPGETFACSDTVIGIHTGDWHAAAARYRSWLKTWCFPYKSQNKQWYRESFWLISEFSDTLEAEAFKLPVWYDEKNKHLRLRDIVEEHSRKAGRSPDILHFWGWCLSPEEKNQIFGGYNEIDYDRLGGLERFKNALDDIQDNMRIPVSLYISHMLCTDSYPIYSKIGAKANMIDSKGKPRKFANNSYTMCHGYREWFEYMRDNYRRVSKETSVKILYVDQFGYDGSSCYAQFHGHEVPMNLIKADHLFIKTIRDEVDESTALYGEFPVVDINSRYLDCNISYYLSDIMAETFDPQYNWARDSMDLGPLYLNLYRYMFPGIVQLDLPQGISTGSWNPLKFIFFNGEAIYDSFWDIEESRAHEFMLKAHDIKKEYADCFTSDSPEMLVPTPKTGVCANMFPGTGRTLWTLYNRKYVTLRGELIFVDHKEGATYYDVWHDRVIVPRIENGRAYIDLEMHPQAIGCIARID